MKEPFALSVFIFILLEVFYRVFSVLQIADQSVLEVTVVGLFHQNNMRSALNNLQF